MDGVQEITQVISSVGFPIVACGALFWMINTTMRELRDAINALTKSLDNANEYQQREAKHIG